LIFEFKGEINGITAEPFVEALAYYICQQATEIRETEVVLVNIVGDLMMIYGVVNYKTYLIVQPLVRPLHFHEDFCSDLTSVFVALSKFGSNNTIPYPDKIFFSESVATPFRFSALAWVSGKSVGYSGDILFKFCEGKYGEDVHRALAEANLAPKLYSVDRIENTSWVRVQMAYLHDYKPLDELKNIDQDRLKDSLETVKAILKRNDFVHGDLRAPNILITQERKNQILILQLLISIGLV
jgi:aminoglycoside phosphotransferase (APT) family kinase protein